MTATLTDEMIAAHRRDGAVPIPGLFAGWCHRPAAGTERNPASPAHDADYLKPGQGGRFFDDRCNRTRIPNSEGVIGNPDAARVAARLAGSDGVQVFRDAVLARGPGASRPTPWHADSGA